MEGLIEPVRQRLVAVAADLLGRVPAEEVPPALRRIARFTPSKRLRLGAPALAAALDTDEDFRAAVGKLVAEGTPTLADAVRAGGPTDASDPVDAAVMAYLLRPEGWEAVLSAATARVRAEREGAVQEAAAGEVTRLRAEIAGLRLRVREDVDRVRAESAAEVARLGEELADARRRLRTVTGEMRAAARQRDEAQAALAEAHRAADAAAAARDAEVRRLKARVGDLEKAGEAVRRGARAEREVDETRLRLLIETISDAAAGIRRELSIGPSTMRPADAVASASAAAADRVVREATTLDAVLALPNCHLIVDGYNVSKTAHGEWPLADQRSWLVNSLAALAARTSVEVTVVFDGGARPPSQPPTPRGVRVLFSAEPEIADDLIRRLVAAEPPGRPVLVASSDQQVSTDVRRADAWTVASALLLGRLG